MRRPLVLVGPLSCIAFLVLLTTSGARASAVTCSAPTLQSGPVASLSGDGTSISTTSGNWDGHGCEISYDYEWQREAFFPVADANDAIYEVATDDDRGLGVSAIVRATNEGGTTAAFTNS